jgi:hypothetical protein
MIPHFEEYLLACTPYQCYESDMAIGTGICGREWMAMHLKPSAQIGSLSDLLLIILVADHGNCTWKVVRSRSKGGVRDPGGARVGKFQNIYYNTMDFADNSVPIPSAAKSMR